jgi:chromosome partitioning protein
VKEIVSIVNQKGGSGKTTTAFSLGTGLKRKGYKVLFIDMDGQGDLSDLMQVYEKQSSLLKLLKKEVDINDIIRKTSYGDIILGSEDLFQTDITITQTNKEYFLKEALGKLQEPYDYIIIDTPPALSVLTINALVASKSIVIASKADPFNIGGIERVGMTVDVVRKYCNEKLLIKGILITQFKGKTNLSRTNLSVIEDIAKKMGTKVFKATIRDTVTMVEVQGKHMSIFEYAPTSNVARDYEAFVEEFLQLEGE